MYQKEKLQIWRLQLIRNQNIPVTTLQAGLTKLLKWNQHHQKGRLAVVLLHLQASILGKAVWSAIAPPYLLCRSRAALWLAWAILDIASRCFGQVFLFAFLQRVLSEVMADGDSEMRFIDVPERTEENLVITVSREERSQNDSQSGADRVENTESHMHQHGRFEYAAHLYSEIYSANQSCI